MTKPATHYRSFTFTLLLMGEIAIGVLYFWDLLPAMLFAMGHIIIIVMLGLILYLKKTQDLTQLVLGFIITMIAGPIGAFSFFLFRYFRRFSSRPERSLLDDWYDRLANSVVQNHETKQFEHIYNGRAAGLGNMSVHHFRSVMNGNNLQEKQTLLGIIALKYQPDYLPILQDALADKDPTVRVQAAAAYTKLRTRFKTILRQNTQPETGETSSLMFESRFRKKVLALSSCLNSGLLDKSERKDLRIYLSKLYDIAKTQKFLSTLETDLVFCDLLNKNGKYEESCQILQNYLHTGNKEVQGLYTKCLLALKKFDKIPSIQP